MAISIIVDFGRSRALMRIAKKYNSQALEADALHFSTDIYSSAVVIFGLVCVSFGVHLADPIAALIVALIVLWVSYNLGKKSFDVLTDKAPQGVIEEVTKIVSAIPEVLLFHDIRAREAGAHVFIELNIHVAKNLSIEQAHEIADTVEKAITGSMKDTKVIVHAEPDQDINNGNEQ
jgi:cation diffusion facilitator family transporter